MSAGSYKPHKTPGNKGNARVGYRTRQSAAEVAKALQQQWREQRLLLRLTFAERSQGKNESVPTKAKVQKMSAGTKNKFGANVLSSCPGGTRDEAGSGAQVAYLKQIAAKETGCKVATDAEKRRLANSAKNCNTTQGNYTHSIVRR